MDYTDRKAPWDGFAAEFLANPDIKARIDALKQGVFEYGEQTARAEIDAAGIAGIAGIEELRGEFEREGRISKTKEDTRKERERIERDTTVDRGEFPALGSQQVKKRK